MGNYYVVFNDSDMIINPLFTHDIPTITHSMSNYCWLNHMSIANINDIKLHIVIIHYYPVLSSIIH